MCTFVIGTGGQAVILALDKVLTPALAVNFIGISNINRSKNAFLLRSLSKYKCRREGTGKGNCRF